MSDSVINHSSLSSSSSRSPVFEKLDDYSLNEDLGDPCWKINLLHGIQVPRIARNARLPALKDLKDELEGLGGELQAQSENNVPRAEKPINIEKLQSAMDNAMNQVRSTATKLDKVHETLDELFFKTKHLASRSEDSVTLSNDFIKEFCTISGTIKNVNGMTKN